MAWSRIAVAGLAALLLAACQPPSVERGLCANDRTCPQGYTCVEGLCVRAGQEAGLVDGSTLDAPRTDTVALDGPDPIDAVALDVVSSVDRWPHPDALSPRDSAVDGAAGMDAAAADRGPGDTGALDRGPDDGRADDTAPRVDGGEPRDAGPIADGAVAPDAVASVDAAGPNDAAGPADAAGPSDSAPPDATTGPDHFFLDRGFNRDRWIVVPDGSVVIDDATIAVATVKNPSFELSASEPQYWTTYGTPCIPSIHTFAPDEDLRPVDGDRAYGCVTTDDQRTGGLWQRVPIQHQGGEWKLSGFVYLHRGCGTTEIRGRLGVDPTGGSDPAGAAVVWAPWVGVADTWQAPILPFTASGTAFTIFVEYALSNVGVTCSGAPHQALFDLVTLLPG